MRKSGFSFIELLVVISIIAALSALIIPMVSGSAELAEAEATKSYLKIVDAGIKAYNAEFDRYPIQAEWVPLPPLNAAVDYWRAPADGNRFTKTNNLAYALAHPDPSVSQDDTERQNAKLKHSYQSNLLLDKLSINQRGGSDVDFTTKTFPYPLHDDYAEGDEPGQPLIYIHDPLGVYKWESDSPVFLQRGRKDANEAAIADGKDPKEYSAFTHAYHGYELLYELWSAGPDGDFHENLHDADLEYNADNITVTPFK